MAAGFWLLVAGGWLLVAGYWRLAFGGWLLADVNEDLAEGGTLRLIVDSKYRSLLQGKVGQIFRFKRIQKVIIFCWLLASGCWLLAGESEDPAGGGILRLIVDTTYRNLPQGKVGFWRIQKMII
jgi:hypothetical protein